MDVNIWHKHFFKSFVSKQVSTAVWNPKLRGAKFVTGFQALLWQREKVSKKPPKWQLLIFKITRDGNDRQRNADKRGLSPSGTILRLLIGFQPWDKYSCPPLRSRGHFFLMLWLAGFLFVNNAMWGGDKNLVAWMSGDMGFSHPEGGP